MNGARETVQWGKVPTAKTVDLSLILRSNMIKDKN